ncbi:MAG: hypothetical protein MHM6MM_000365 [Cercozoa sp. M6MM]
MRYSSSTFSLVVLLFPKAQREPEHEESQNNSDSEHFSVRPIGKVHSIWREKFGCPRQGSLCSGPARVTLSPDLDPTALRSLEQYSHCWLLFLFDRNANFDATNKTSSLRSLVRAPRFNGEHKIGVFASRSPHRPNPIGLSLVKIKSIEGNTLHLENVDLVDGTPVIDVKPVHPSDVPQQVKYPTWLPSNDALLGIDTALVKWHPLALQQLHQVTDFDLLTSAQEAHNVINDTLKMDCRTAHSKANHGDGAYYGLSIDSLLVDFQVNTNPLTFTVVRVRHERATQTPQRSKQWLHELQEYVAQHSMECEPECE